MKKIFRKKNTNASRRETSAGFSIVEAMFSSIIGLVIMGLVMILYVKINETMVVGMALAEINSNARSAMDRIVRDVRWGTQLEETHDIDGITYTTGVDQLIIKVPSIDEYGKYMSGTFDHIIYAIDTSDSRKLRRIIDPHEDSHRPELDQLVANNLNSFALSSEGVPLGTGVTGLDSVEVSINVNKNPMGSSDKTVSETIFSNAELRNR